MKIAHARERNAPAGAPFRIMAALDQAGRQWLDLEVARRRAANADERLAHNSVLFRQPLTTLDEILTRGLRVAALGELLDRFEPRANDDAVADATDLAFGSPILRPTSVRDFYAFEQHVSTIWSRRGQEIPDAWFRLPIFYFSNLSEIRGPGEPVWPPDSSQELDYELEIAALIDTPVKNLDAARGEEAIGGFMIMNDWSARDLQRDETAVRLGPAKGKDFATTFGPWLVTPDELADKRSGKAYNLACTAEVNGQVISRGNLGQIHHSFGAMIERASADVRLIPGDVIGSGTVGGCCLLEVKDESGFGRYLVPGDRVILKVDRLGELSSPVVSRPD
ncbi:MAG: fumarylacetoacetate hydrolase family protein [Chloroflexota bacterium]|nr:fumarylacetoacetate hydrolase family protein [Chloroflexota bacterium]